MTKCKHCGSDNPEDIKICLSCGRSLSALHASGVEKYELDFSSQEMLQNQIRDYFFKMLRFRIETELDANGYRDYFDLFHSSGFYNKFDIRSQQLAEEFVSDESEKTTKELNSIAKTLDQTLTAFVDFFIIVYCQPLHKMILPSAILRYEKIEKESLDLKQMILEFLDFENEKDKVYTDFVSIPTRKMKNAKAVFLFTEGDEQLIFLCDQTVFGSCKEGFAMTDKAIYWKAHFNEASKVTFKDLDRIEKEGEWITINSHFFNVNKTMNYKMMKLLQKLQSLNKQ